MTHKINFYRFIARIFERCIGFDSKPALYFRNKVYDEIDFLSKPDKEFLPLPTDPNLILAMLLEIEKTDENKNNGAPRYHLQSALLEQKRGVRIWLKPEKEIITWY